MTRHASLLLIWCLCGSRPLLGQQCASVLAAMDHPRVYTPDARHLAGVLDSLFDAHPHGPVIDTHNGVQDVIAPAIHYFARRVAATSPERLASALAFMASGGDREMVIANGERAAALFRSLDLSAVDMASLLSDIRVSARTKRLAMDAIDLRVRDSLVQRAVVAALCELEIRSRALMEATGRSFERVIGDDDTALLSDIGYFMARAIEAGYPRAQLLPLNSRSALLQRLRQAYSSLR